MAIDSKEKWNPLSRTRFDEILAEEVTSLPPDATKIYADYGIGVVEQPCDRGEQHGIEHVFVVARAARAAVRLLLFDDAEDEFAVGELDTDGVLRRWDLYGDLVFALRNLLPSTWRLLGDLPQARTREEIRTQSLDGWSPWQHPWNRCDEPYIVVPDSEGLRRFRHAPTYWVKHNGKVIKFAVDQLECGEWRFFVPAASTEEGAFEVRIPRYEGFWRSSSHADENLPWPQPEANGLQRATFLEALDRAETEAQRVSYCGFSHCRVCGCENGSQSFRLDVWEWPSGFLPSERICEIPKILFSCSGRLASMSCRSCTCRIGSLRCLSPLCT